MIQILRLLHSLINSEAALTWHRARNPQPGCNNTRIEIEREGNQLLIFTRRAKHNAAIMENTSSSSCGIRCARGGGVCLRVTHKGFNESLSADRATKARTTWDTPGARSSFFLSLQL
jgi:hypothetical protein